MKHGGNKIFPAGNLTWPGSYGYLIWRTVNMVLVLLYIQCSLNTIKEGLSLKYIIQYKERL